MVKKPNAPCKDCKKRFLGCHSKCAEYIQFVEDGEKYREQKRINGTWLHFNTRK